MDWMKFLPATTQQLVAMTVLVGIGIACVLAWGEKTKKRAQAERDEDIAKIRQEIRKEGEADAARIMRRVEELERRVNHLESEFVTVRTEAMAIWEQCPDATTRHLLSAMIARMP